jgi:hypothetical protein
VEEEDVGKYDVGDDLGVRFKRKEERFDAEEMSVYRVSVNQLTEGSVMKKIDTIKTENDCYEKEKVLRFEDEHEIVFIRTDVTIFDNTQVDKNQMFIVSTPYTIFLWVGQEVKFDMLRGAISIFRTFSYKIRKIPLIFIPSYLDEEQNLSIPNFQIIF